MTASTEHGRTTRSSKKEEEKKKKTPQKNSAGAVGIGQVEIIFSQRARKGHPNIGTVSNAKLGKLMRDRVERVCAFQTTYIAS